MKKAISGAFFRTNLSWYICFFVYLVHLDSLHMRDESSDNGLCFDEYFCRVMIPVLHIFILKNDFEG